MKTASSFESASVLMGMLSSQPARIKSKNRSAREYPKTKSVNCTIHRAPATLEKGAILSEARLSFHLIYENGLETISYSQFALIARRRRADQRRLR
jgi:hypothetical protein